jgi:hypothetical protein
MDEELMESIFLNTLENLPSFGGKLNEDVNKWLAAITNGFNFVGFNDNDKVRIIHTYLTGDARRMIMNNMAVLNEWTSFVQLIRRIFDSSFQKQVVIPQVNDVQQDLNATIIQREHVVVESVDIIEDQKTSLVEDEEPVELVQVEESVELIQEEEETMKLIQEEEETMKLIQEEEETMKLIQEEETVKLVQGEEEEETVKLVQIEEEEEETVELIPVEEEEEIVELIPVEEEEEETVELIPVEEKVELIQDEEKDAKTFDNFITTSLQNEKILNEIGDDNNGLLCTSMLQAYENMEIIIHLLLMTGGKHQLIETIDITRLKNSFSTCHNNGSTDTSRYLKYGTNRQTFWYNFSPYKTNHWEWFRTLAVP